MSNKSKSRKKWYDHQIVKIVYRYAEDDHLGIRVVGVVSEHGDTVPFALFLQSLYSKNRGLHMTKTNILQIC